MDFVTYKIKPAFRLLKQGRFGYLAGALSEQIVGKNPYEWYRCDFRDDCLERAEILGYTMYLDVRDRGISRHLLIRGIHEPLAMRAYIEELSDVASQHSNPTVLDVGANIGYYALLESEAMNGNGTVVAVEPNPRNFELLKRNLEANNKQNVDCYQFAISDEDGEAEFAISDHSNWSRLVSDDESQNSDSIRRTVSVPTKRLRTLLAFCEQSPESVAGLRMDLEGHETQILLDSEWLLEKGNPQVLFLELHPDFVGSNRYVDALDILKENGYRIQHVDKNRTELEVDEYTQLKEIRGSHIRLILRS